MGSQGCGCSLPSHAGQDRGEELAGSQHGAGPGSSSGTGAGELGREGLICHLLPGSKQLLFGKAGARHQRATIGHGTSCVPFPSQ